ncbi:hypothetical protein [Jannaschia ovalis]|uniref:Uncharacterized protein n=1 Tax=Jannaschia ovalis TaxID=3038773 RepID=A0ABY8LD71_9RHOB|nr:hypothetical protein [Jannaschia sp. GRR-S6-38]WGH79269.1 hypothetical protein P8627_03110 [Jannaschia sp. GRR-S6-38]
MNALRLTRARPPRDLIDSAIAVHGARRVLLAAAAALLRPRPRPPDASTLPDHLRRDIGLDPLPPAPPSARLPY